jgi:LAO/AO transport system kinase
MAKDLENEARDRALARIRASRARSSGGVDGWMDQLLSGDRTALAQAISLVESTLEEDRRLAEQLIARASAQAGPALRYGITGVPGAGKSTWIEAAGLHLISRGHKVAVLAVDPSSSRTGGSLLGDKTRMSTLAQHEHAFVRPSPSGRALGGVAEATSEITLLCAACGFDRILIETVGVGQSETEVRRMTDLFLLLLIPGAGDGIQGIKRGILEWADAVWVNKADGEAARLEAAQSALAVYRAALALLAPPSEGAPPLFDAGSSLDAGQVASWVDRLEERLEAAVSSGSLERRRSRQMRDSLEAMLTREALERVRRHPQFAPAWAQLQDASLRAQIPPYEKVRQLLDALD